MDALIRKATPDDAAQVASVMNAVILEGRWTALTNPFTEAEERAFIAGLGARSAMFVAAVEANIVGIQVIEPDGLAHYTDSMRHVGTVGTWIHTDFRGHRIGQCLAEASFAFARDNGYEKLSIQVLVHNERARRFYSKLGFEEFGVARKHVKLDGCFYDAVYLEKFL